MRRPNVGALPCSWFRALGFAEPRNDDGGVMACFAYLLASCKQVRLISGCIVPDLPGANRVFSTSTTRPACRNGQISVAVWTR